MATLKKGSKGQDVRKIQIFFGLVSHGVFDRKLDWAVRRWQGFMSLKVDGKVGPKTKAKMGLNSSSSYSSEITEQDIRDIIAANADQLTTEPNENNPSPVRFDPDKHVIVVAIRGYNLDMGKDDVNDRRIYDDAHFIVTPRGMVKFNGNTDPNGYRKGYGKGSSKGMACLDEGVWFFGRGPHKGRPAFRQAVPFRVIRDGNPPYPHTGYHAINWHDGGQSSTSSLGCQTNRPSDFSKLRSYIYESMEDFDNPKMYLDYKSYGKVHTVPYILINETERRKGNLKV